MRSDNVMAAFANFRTKTVAAIATGQEIEIEKTVNAPYDALKVFGKSEQKAKWNQAEGVTWQIQETGYNLLDCEAEWLPVGNDGEKGITNIATGKGSVSFDVDGNGVPYLENQKALHLKAGSYYVSGLNSETLDSVGFSGISEPIWGSCNGVITVSEEGDYKFYIYPMSYAHSMTISNLMIVEGDTSKTYQEYGYSKPSPAYPSELTSHISAGSYQIPTENGIYEVTLTEELRGLDDTYRDKICFDSISGTGYLEQNTQKVNMQDKNISNYGGIADATLHFGMAYDFDKAKVSKNQFKCTHFPFVAGAFYNPTEDSMTLYKNTDTANSLFVNIRKEHLDITDFSVLDENVSSFKRWISANNPTVILPRTTPLKTALTFTKVESSTLPLLPWTAYGKNLIPFEPFEIPEGSSGSRNYPAPPLIVGETYYPSGKLSDGTTLNSDNCAFILLKNGVQLWNKSPRSITITEELAETDTVSVYVNKKEGGKTVAEFQFELGSAKTDYEPFNPTPPESITPSSDYPQQIYDLKDVTVTSRGRNLFDETTYPCVFNGNQTTNYKIDINAKTAGAYTLYCVISGMDGIVYSSTGGLISVEIGYSDSTIKWDSLATSSSAVNDVIIINTNADKKLSYVRIWKHDRFTGGTITLKNVSILEGTYTADTLPPFDKYRCTSATIPLTLKSCGDDKDYTVSDNQTVNLCSYIKEVVIDGTLNNFVCNVVGSASSQACSFFVKYNGTNYERLKAGSTISNTHGFTAVPKSDSGNYLPYITIPWSVLGLTSAPTTAEANEAAKSYCAEQNALGTPLIIRYVLYTPIITEITDAWAQDLLGLKTAPYWTKIYTDKETGGLEATYKHF